MSQQSVKVIDVTKSYIPGDPNAFPANMGFTGSEDSPFQSSPILPYEGYNFLPTNYGYKSYFGLTGVLGINALPSKPDWILVYQRKTLENFLIALTELGIYTKDSTVAGAWTQSIALAAPPGGTHTDWTWCVIGEVFYCYRQAGAAYYSISPYTVYWIPDDPVPGLAAIVDTIDNTATIPAGTYTYYVAYKENVTNYIAVHGEGISVTVPTLGDSVDFTWGEPLGVVAEYVMYRVDSLGAIVYQETNSTLESFTDTGAGWLTDTLPVAGAIQYAPYAVQTVTPNTLNMAGQLGIFKAGVRLGFWDSENSVGHSALDDKSDFVTSLETMANTGQKFDNLIGKIVTIKQMGDGFIIYATKCILYVERTISEAFMWRSWVVTGEAGIAYPKEVTTGQVDTEHYAWSSMGLIKITEKDYKILVPSVSDFLRESKDPVYPRLMQNRYLFLNLLSPDYIDGKVSFTTELVEPLSLSVSFGGALAELEAVDTPGCQKFNIITKIPDQIVVYKENSGSWSGFSFTTLGYPVGVDVPVYSARTRYYARIFGLSTEASMQIVPTEGLSAVVDTSVLATYQAGVNPGFYYNWDVPYSVDVVISSPYAIGIEAERNFAYVGSLEAFFANQLQSWYGTIRFFNQFIDEQIAQTGSEDSAPVVGSVVSPATIDADYAIFNALLTIGADYQNLFYALLPCALGEVQIEAETVGGIEYATIGLRQHVTQWRGFVLVSQASRVSSVLTSTGPDTWTHFLHLNWQKIPVTVDVDPCNGFVVTCANPALVANLTATITANGGILGLLIKDYTFRASMHITSFIQYALDGSSTPSGTPAPAQTFPASCPTDDDAMIFGTIFGGFNTANGSICGSTPTTPGAVFSGITDLITIPASSFLMQEGSPAPLYPTFYGALVYDLHIEKWGKLKAQYKELLDYSPINNISSGTIPYEVFGVEGALVNAAGFITSFDEAPTDSWIKYGKVGYFRQGFTDPEEIIVHFRRGSTGTIGIVTSIDGRSEDGALAENTTFTIAMEATHYGGYSGKWHGIKISGNYDIQYLEFRGHRKSRR